MANGQTLQGSGTVQGNLAASAGSTVAPGTSAATGTLNVSGNATLNGNTVMKLNGASNDGLSAGGTLTYGGTLTLTNISAPLAAGNSFTLFGAAGYSGSFAAITPATPGAGLAWNTNNLTVNGTISVVSTAAPAPHYHQDWFERDDPDHSRHQRNIQWPICVVAEHERGLAVEPVDAGVDQLV